MKKRSTLFDDLNLIKFCEGHFLGELFVAGATLNFKVPFTVLG